MSNIFYLLVLGLLSHTIVLRLLVSGSTAGVGVNLFITSFIVIAYLAWLVGQALTGEIKVARLFGLGALLLVWALAIILSPLWSAYKFGAASVAFIWLGDILLFYLIIQVAGYQPKVNRLIINVLLATAVVITCYALYQYIWGLDEVRKLVATDPAALVNIPPELKDEFLSRVNANEPFGTFIYQNSLGGFLVLVIPVLLAGLIKSISNRHWSLVIGHLSFVILMGFILYTTGAKGAWVACLISLIIFTILLIWRYLSKTLRLIIPVLSLIILGILFLAVVKDESMQIRFGYWQGAWEVIRHNLWTGVGFNNFINHYTMYKPVWAGETTQAHNVLLEVFSGLGIIGFVAFCSIWLIIVVRGLWFVKTVISVPGESVYPVRVQDESVESVNSVHRPNGYIAIIIGAFVAFALAQIFEGTFAIADLPEISLLIFFLIWLGSFLFFSHLSSFTFHLSTGLVAGVIGFLVHSLVDFNFSEAGLSLSIWLVGACLVGLIFVGKSYTIKIMVLSKAMLIIGSITVILLLNLWLVPRLMRCDNLIEESKEALSAGKYEWGTKNLWWAKTINPYDIRPHLELARFYHTHPSFSKQPDKIDFQRWQKATYEHLDEAIRLSPFSASLYYLKGRFLEEDAYILESYSKDKITAPLLLKREEILKESAESFRQAVHFYPTKPEYLYRLGRALEAIGQRQEAMEVYQQALKVNQQVTLKRLKLKPDEVNEILK